MTIFAPSTEQPHLGSGDQCRSAWGQNAGGPRESYLLRRLARRYWAAVCFGVALPPLTMLSSILPLTLGGAAIVTASVSVALVYILSILTEFHADLKTAKRLWDEREDSIVLLQANYDALAERYDHLYAEYLLQRGAVPLVAKRARGMVADLPSGVNGSATVVPLNPKGAGA